MHADPQPNGVKLARRNTLGLERGHYVATGKDTHVLTWLGSEMNSVLAFALISAGLECVVLDIGVTVVDTQPVAIQAILRQIADAPPSIEDIADFVDNLRTAKFDELVPEPMLRRLWAQAHQQEAVRLPELARWLADGMIETAS